MVSHNLHHEAEPYPRRRLLPKGQHIIEHPCNKSNCLWTSVDLSDQQVDLSLEAADLLLTVLIRPHQAHKGINRGFIMDYERH